MDATSMDLILVRHAVAHERDAASWPDDARRPLTEDGAADFARMAKRLGRVLGSVDLVESSAFDRAWQTALILRDQAGWPRPRRAERLEPDGDGAVTPERMQSLVRSIAAMRGLRTVAWVGHEPMLSSLASQLLVGRAGAMEIDFRKGAALALRIDSPGADLASVAGRARLLWMLTPRIVRRMKRGKR